MSSFRFSPQAGPRLLAAFGTAALLTGIGLASSRPVRSAGGPIAVTVANAPLPTTNADDHDKQGIQGNIVLTIANGTSGVIGNIYTVPAHKRLVLDTLSASAFDYGRYTISCSTVGGTTDDAAYATFSVLPDGSFYPSGSLQTHQFADAGSSVTIGVDRIGFTGNGDLRINFTGHLVDMP